MKKIILSHLLAFQLFLNKKRIIKKGLIYLTLALCIANNVFAQPGTLDRSFGTDGRIVVPGTNQYGFENNEQGSMAIQKDGKILITGDAFNYATNMKAFGIVRLNPDGSLDKSFSDDGKAFAEMSNRYANPRDICIAPDGKIIVTGDVRNLRNGDTYYRFAAVRLNADGTHDKSFDDDGILLLEEFTSSENSFSVALQEDGKILLAGYGINPKTNDYNFKVILLNANGSVDTSFGDNGRIFIDMNIAYRIRVQPDKKIVVSGRSFYINSYDFGIVRLNPDGSLDTSFGSGGKTSIDFEGNNDFAYDLVIQNDGKILVAGSTFNKNTSTDANDYAIARLNSNGTLDNSFGENGKKTIDFSNSDDRGEAVAVQKNGSILMNGSSIIGSTVTFGIVRLLPDGNLDTDFAEGGKRLLNFLTPISVGHGVVIQPDEKIVVGGASGQQPAIARLISDNNFPPILDSIGFQSVKELEELRFTAKVTDKDTPANLLKFSLAEAPVGSFPTGAQINASTGVFSWTPTEQQGPGTYHLKIMVSDGSNIDAEEFRIKVREVNLPPSFTIGADQTILEDTERSIENWATNITAGEGEDNQTLSFIGSNKNKDLFRFSPSPDARGDLFLKPQLNANGSDTITLVLKDNAGTDYGGIDESSPQTFIVKVIPVNDAPTFTLNSINFVTKPNSGPQSATKWALSISKGPANESGQNLMFLVSNNNNSLFSTQPSIDTSGTLNFTAANNATGTARVTVILKDDGGTSNGGIDQSPTLTFTITIAPENEKAVALYSTTPEGGAGDGGTIIKFAPSSNSLTVVKSFDLNSTTDGFTVTGSLVQASDKKLYGMTTLGGTLGYGVIFFFDPATSTYKKLKDFDAINGSKPHGGLMQANDGKLYGMTSSGGSNDRGVIFSFDPRDLTYTKLKDFTGPDGASPQGGLIQASDGKLYGMTASGGVGQGVIFSFDFITGTFRNLKNFDTPFFDFNVGSAPYGNLIQANDGIMYGMTSGGGFEGDGTVFSFDPVTLRHDNFINFNDHENPGGSLIQANDGKLYGMDYGGGGNGDGEILSIDLPGLDQAFFSFDPTTGIRPLGTLMQASDGYLYGTTSEGGTHQKGIIFSFNISTGIITRRKDFDGENGAFPGTNSNFIEVSIDEINTPPVLTAIGNKSVNELVDFRFTAKATDNDSPDDTLKFSLANAAIGKFPEGATIDKSSGLFCWTPTEAQGPGTYRVKIVVSDGECTDEEEIEIKVCEINSKPVLATISDQTVDENKVLTFTATAFDKDIPENTLTFSLADPSSGDFPIGASINASTGAFNWLPSKTQVPGIFRIKVIVSDGTATDEEEFAIHVRKTSPATLTAFPNPSAQHATVRFAIPADEAMVTLVIYDFKGQQIHHLYEGRAEANRPYSFDLSGSNLKPGVYLIKLSMSQKAETFKMIITE